MFHEFKWRLSKYQIRKRKNINVIGGSHQAAQLINSTIRRRKKLKYEFKS